MLKSNLNVSLKPQKPYFAQCLLAAAAAATKRTVFLTALATKKAEKETTLTLPQDRPLKCQKP